MIVVIIYDSLIKTIYSYGLSLNLGLDLILKKKQVRF